MGCVGNQARCRRVVGALDPLNAPANTQGAAAPTGVRCCVIPYRQRTQANAPGCRRHASSVLLIKVLGAGEAGPRQTFDSSDVSYLPDALYGSNGSHALNRLNALHWLHRAASRMVREESRPVVSIEEPAVSYPAEKPAFERINPPFVKVSNRLSRPEVQMLPVWRIASRSSCSIEKVHAYPLRGNKFLAAEQPPTKAISSPIWPKASYPISGANRSM